VKFAFIKESLNEYPVDVCCDVLDVSRSGYYAWRDRPESAQKKRRELLATKVKTVFEENRSVYGSPRICEALRAQGEIVNKKTIARSMKELEIQAKTKKRFVPSTTDSNHANPVVENVLDRGFSAQLPNQKWAVDITYIHTDQGWLYLAGVMDLCSRMIVGWSMADHMRTELVTDAMQMALARRQPGGQLIHHSDRGIQYTSDDYMHLLQSQDIQPSMSGKGNCWDNAAMESFWATIKTEMVYREHYTTHDQARATIF
jgi:transposase InsO family protein